MNCVRVGCSAVLITCALVANLIAQPPASRVTSTSAVTKANAAGWQEKLEAALARKVSVDATDSPLKEVVQQLADQADFPYRLSKKIEDAGVQPDKPVTAKFADLTLESVLKHVLEDINLTFTLHNEMIVITTVEDAQSPEKLITRVYPVKDLVELQPTTPINTEILYEFDPLLDLIHGSIEPDGWGDGNHPGTLQGFHKSGALVVSNRWDIHQRVAQLLADLRRAKAEQETVLEPPPKKN